MGLSANVRGGVLLVLSLLACIMEKGDAVWLTLPSKGMKCVSEELHSNIVVLADYDVMSENHALRPTVSVKVTSPYGNNLHHHENTTHGQFAFTTKESGNYLACFTVDGNQGDGISMNIEWRTGIAAKDWASVARKEKLEGFELELAKLEATVKAIHENILYLKSKESDMRSVSETTNTRVAWYSIMSLAVCIGASVGQILYLTRYFQKKKLI